VDDKNTAKLMQANSNLAASLLPLAPHPDGDGTAFTATSMLWFLLCLLWPLLLLLLNYPVTLVVSCFKPASQLFPFLSDLSFKQCALLRHLPPTTSVNHVCFCGVEVASGVSSPRP